MIKGVNRFVIEVNDIANPYFERVVCYVRPEYSGEKDSVLRSEAVNYVKIISEDKKTEVKSKKTVPVWVISVASAAVGAVACWAVSVV